MAHTESLRVLGQWLEAAKIPAFELEEDGLNYIVKSKSLPQTDEWVLRHTVIRKGSPDQTPHQSTVPSVPTVTSVRFSRADIFRLDDEARLQRGRNSPQPNAFRRLSQQLRTLGGHLDRMNASAFQICWECDSVAVFFRRLDGQRDSITYTPNNLERMSSSSRFRRSITGFRKPSNLRNR